MASRRLLYYVEKNIVKSRDNPMWKQFIRTNYQQIEKNQSLIEDFIQLHSSTANYRELLASYNIGVKRSERELVEMAAKRVGLELPKVMRIN